MENRQNSGISGDKVSRRIAIGETIQKRLENFGKNQADLVGETGISKSTISKYINGDQRISKENAKKIGKALLLSEDFLQGKSDAADIETADLTRRLLEFEQTKADKEIIELIIGLGFEISFVVGRIHDKKLYSVKRNDFDTLQIDIEKMLNTVTFDKINKFHLNVPYCTIIDNDVESDAFIYKVIVDDFELMYPDFSIYISTLVDNFVFGMKNIASFSEKRDLAYNKYRWATTLYQSYHGVKTIDLNTMDLSYDVLWDNKLLVEEDEPVYDDMLKYTNSISKRIKKINWLKDKKNL